MNKLLFIFLLTFLFGHSLSAQSYFPQGATWTFHAPDALSASFSFTTIESMGDSIFNGDTLTYLQGYVVCSEGNNEFVKQVGEKIYKLNKCDSTFSLLYDFGVNVGDTLVYSDVCQFSDSLQLRVDSIIPISINGNTLNQFYMSHLNFVAPTYFGGNVIQGIGNTSSFYPIIGVCDPPGGPLRCYNDTVIGEYNSGLYGGVCDTVFVGIDEYPFSNLSIYPNPTTGKLTIDLVEARSNLKITLANSLGQIVQALHFNSKRYINLTIDEPIGIYLLKIDTPEGKVKTIKVLKE